MLLRGMSGRGVLEGNFLGMGRFGEGGGRGFEGIGDGKPSQGKHNGL